MKLYYGYDEREISEIRLAWASLGHKKVYGAITHEYPSAEDGIKAILDGKFTLANAVNRIGPGLNDREGFRALMESMKKCGARCLTRNSPGYPKSMRGMPDEPVMLFAIGEADANTERNVAIVGSRKNTDYGARVATRIAADLAHAGVSIVSGMALGIDSVAQTACLDAGGSAIGFVAGGIEKVVPAASSKLYARMRENGLLLSEHPPGTRTEKWMFLQRNRLITGVSQALLLVEAAKKSGTVSTIEFAMSQGREVFATPGRIYDENSYLPNLLIIQGAYPVTGAEDICSVMRWDAPAKKRSQKREKLDVMAMNSVDRAIVLALTTGEKRADELLNMIKISAEELMAHLTSLELEGIIEQFPGRLIELKDKYRVQNGGSTSGGS